MPLPVVSVVKYVPGLSSAPPWLPGDVMYGTTEAVGCVISKNRSPTLPQSSSNEYAISPAHVYCLNFLGHHRFECGVTWVQCEVMRFSRGILVQLPYGVWIHPVVCKPSLRKPPGDGCGLRAHLHALYSGLKGCQNPYQWPLTPSEAPSSASGVSRSGEFVI